MRLQGAGEREGEGEGEGEGEVGRGEMIGRKVVVYYAWSRPGEAEAPLEVIENRWPTLFESRRIALP